jgi:hypothetical protein
MTFRLALVTYFMLLLAWIVSGYFRRRRSGDAGSAAGEEPRSPQGRHILYVLLWAAIVVAIATGWHVLHPGE